jgi:hypothetical protein
MIKYWQTPQQWIKKHLWVTFIVATAILTTAIHFYVALFVPPTLDKAWKEVQVTEGMSFKAIAAMLQKVLRDHRPPSGHHAQGPDGVLRSRQPHEHVGGARRPAQGKDHRV